MSRPVPSWLNSELWRKSSEVNSKILSKITNLLSTSDEIVGTTSEAATNVSDTKDPLKASVHPESKSKIAEDKSRNFDGKGESYKTETTGNYAQNIPQSSSEGDPKGTKSLPNSEDVDAKKIERTSVVDEKKLNEERRKARLYTEVMIFFLFPFSSLFAAPYFSILFFFKARPKTNTKRGSSKVSIFRITK